MGSHEQVTALPLDDERLAARAAGWVDGPRRLPDRGRFLFTVAGAAVVRRPA